ncbi:cyclic nucleotide-binding domain-containing protein [Hymenobacter taeanensis]|uniref:Cyclic nucleotide-binding domain-containing protein n=1 Tax=Hymenobacter taeanensis TaxID=2735321 RepID=A0A6M6BKK8_9BACT|nr:MULTISPECIES: cyclic nucleotide-binding domain-containing protein [Hymenobacter]QJX47943.1 cyclic nucleotide-binding domain-containing protein [Hymenobacter taeanensis]UOQ82607.1 cyclic nucleotide-binding domain-containing protein [Hymenobacter sp. 5414T-23]
METWQHFLGIRSREVKSVWLFFLHNFLLGIGTILVYVVATVLLLEHEPARSLPLAYGLSAILLIGGGKVYGYFEHQLALTTLATRTLLVVAGFALLMGLLLAGGPAVGTAIALMLVYRLIYLLTHLEFWGVSAVVFDVRQGRRLFGLISAGDLPAKALGAVLAIFVHGRTELLNLVLLAFGAYAAALYVQRLTFRFHVVEARPVAPRPHQTLGSPLLRQLLGSSPLILTMGLSALAVAAVATSVEYLFLIQVKEKLQDQSSILVYVSSVLAFLYLLATLGKVLLTRRGLDVLGLHRTLLLLPAVTLGGLALFGALQLTSFGPGTYLVYLCGLYLGLEVLRRAVFEPAFLVLFQPLSPQERLHGHTLVKGFYEPLGMGLTGLLLFALYDSPLLGQGLLFLWMALLLVGTLVVLRHTHHRYLAELKAVLSRRFPASLTPAETVPPPTTWLTTDLLRVREDLDNREAQAAAEVAPQEADSTHTPAVPTSPSVADAQLHHPDLAVRQTAIWNRLSVQPTHAFALASLLDLATADEPQARRAALTLIQFLPPAHQVTLIHTCLHSTDPALMKAASEAVTQAPSPEIVKLLIATVKEKALRKSAADGLMRLGEAALPALETALHSEKDYAMLRRLAAICAHLATPASRRVLVSLAQQPHLRRRAAALQALSSFPAVQAEAPLFQNLMQKEMRLAQQLLHGMLGANVELRACLKYELTKVQQRLFSLLLQLYDRQPILDAQRSIARTSHERQANALEMLDNLIPRPLYQGLQALVDVGRLTKKVQTFDTLLGPIPPESIVATILERGDEVFSPWTISVALRQWQPTPATVSWLQTYLNASNSLVHESAEDVLQLLPARYPAVYEHWLVLYPAPEALNSPPPPLTHVSTIDRLLLLKHTTLFAETVENVLSNIVPIMQEVKFQDGESIFAKGDLGTSLYIIYDGEVSIMNEEHHLATFRTGDFFGELALLDAEPRSASAMAHGEVTAFRLDQEDFYDVMEECSEVLHNILRVLCQRLRLQNERLKQLSEPHHAQHIVE